MVIDSAADILESEMENASALEKCFFFSLDLSPVLSAMTGREAGAPGGMEWAQT